MSRNAGSKFLLPAVVAGITIAAGACFGADPVQKATSTVAHGCIVCHQAQPNTLFGNFDNVAFKAKTIQLRIDNAVELVRFDEDEVKVVTSAGKSGDGDYLHQTRKGQELKIEYSEKDGIKTALRVVEKPPVKVAPEMLISGADFEKLVSQTPQKGHYFLFDSRPTASFQDGAIPGAASLPDPSLETLAGSLPVDKGAQLVFYCAGPTCTSAPAVALQAKTLGYLNTRVYRDGMQGWSAKNFSLLSARGLKDLATPHLLLDVRGAKDAAKGVIKGAVSFPAPSAAKLIDGLPAKERKPPVVLYDAKDGKQSAKVAKLLIKEGYDDIRVLQGGFDAWKAAKFPTAHGKLAAKAVYTPTPREGEVELAVFRRAAERLPADTIILDVRNADEVKSGMVKTAKNIPFDQLQARSAEIPRDKTVIAQCTTGVRAEMAYHWLKALGFTRVKFLNATVTFEKDGSYTIAAK